MIKTIILLTIGSMAAGIILATIFARPKTNVGAIELLENGDSSFGKALKNLKLSNSCGKARK